MLEFLVEQRLEEAVSRGELANLPGEGRPLELDDDALVPEELRPAYRILVHSGCDDAAARSKALRKLALLRIRLERR